MCLRDWRRHLRYFLTWYMATLASYNKWKVHTVLNPRSFSSHFSGKPLLFTPLNRAHFLPVQKSKSIQKIKKKILLPPLAKEFTTNEIKNCLLNWLVNGKKTCLHLTPSARYWSSQIQLSSNTPRQQNCTDCRE